MTDIMCGQTITVYHHNLPTENSRQRTLHVENSVREPPLKRLKWTASGQNNPKVYRIGSHGYFSLLHQRPLRSSRSVWSFVGFSSPPVSSLRTVGSKPQVLFRSPNPPLRLTSTLRLDVQERVTSEVSHHLSLPQPLV